MRALRLPDLVWAYTQNPEEVKRNLAFLPHLCYHAVAVFDMVGGRLADSKQVATVWDVCTDLGLAVILSRTGLERLSPLQRRDFFDRLATFNRDPFLHICDEGEILSPFERRLLLAQTGFTRQCLGPGTSPEWTFLSAAVLDGDRILLTSNGI
jgi:hypothetical protein